jgi:ATP-dependent protease ClpP protease subunit
LNASLTTSSNSSTTHNVSETETNASNSSKSFATSETESKSESETSSSHVIHNVQGAVSFTSAAAKNIAVDGSTINDTNTYSVILAGSAEQNATALNIVNSAGGMVANGLNIAHTTNLTTMPVLTQVNSISQVR